MLSRWQSTIVDERGNVQPLANLTVRLESDQSLAKMWASPGTSQPLPDGMLQADGNGYAFFYARGGLYRIQSAALGIDWRGVQIGAALVSIGDYTAGLEITARNQTFWRDGELYRAGAALELPYTTTGDWGDEEGLFVAVGDRSVFFVDSIQSLISSSKMPGSLYFVMSYFKGEDFGGGLFYYDENRASENDGGLVFDGFVRILETNEIYPSMFGGGMGIDDSVSIVSAVNAIKNDQILVLERSYILKEKINLPQKIKINVLEKLIIDGDEDFWLIGEEDSEIEFLNFCAEHITPEEERTLLNRILRFNSPKRVKINTLETHKATTSLHCSFGEELIIGNAYLYDMVGENAQYGYGINTGAKRTEIGDIYAFNSTPSGRHVFYSTGGDWEWVNIKSINCSNVLWNPVSIANTNLGATGTINIERVSMFNCNKNSSTVTGGVQIGQETSPDLRVVIGSIIFVDSYGTALGKGAPGADNIYVESVKIHNAKAKDGDNYGIHIRHGTGHNINKITMSISSGNYLGVLRFRESTNNTLGTIRSLSNSTNSILNLLDASCRVDSVEGLFSTERIFSARSEIFDSMVLPQTFLPLPSGNQPYVGEGKCFYTEDASSRNINFFEGGQEGQVIILVARTGNNKIINNTSSGGITTKSGSDVELDTRHVFTCVYFGGRWLEI